MIVIAIPKHLEERIEDEYGSRRELARWVTEAVKETLNWAADGDELELDPRRNEYVPQGGETAYTVTVTDRKIAKMLAGIRGHEDYESSWEEGIAKALPRLQASIEECVFGNLIDYSEAGVA
jgi:hypothetical protein